MMEDILMDAIGELDESLLEEHLAMREELALQAIWRKKAWRGCVAVAASAVLILGTVLLWKPLADDGLILDQNSGGVSDGVGSGDNNGTPDHDDSYEGLPPEGGMEGDGVTEGSGVEGDDGSEDHPYDPVLPEKMPKHFQFSLVWGTNGISSYDSQTGELVKTTDATHPEEYKTILHLSRAQLEEIYALIYRLNVADYPENYNPFPDYGSDPSYTIVLSVYDGIGVKNIECREIAIPDGVFTMDAKAKAFIETYRAIRDILTETEEWKSLPEYENFYD
ncbi:MAG: hypothetical protein E7599_07690 [Ruminococcaceae bacterium]|nr:hypothetical protein [Oscillospiraceae bacterium]